MSKKKKSNEFVNEQEGIIEDGLKAPGIDEQPDASGGAAEDTQSAAEDAQSAAEDTQPAAEYTQPAAEPETADGKKKRKPWSTKKKVLVSIAAAVAILLISGGAYAYSIWSNPMGQFQTALQQKTEAPAPTVSGDGSVGDSSTPEPTVNPYDELVSKADMGFLDHIVNIMLIGVDHSVERDTWSGKKAFHSDVMIVLAINTETREVSMISLPRDTYGKIPGVDGIYKLNASIDCGGGWPTEEGFRKVCESAMWMLGDEVPIQYYYAVDMNAVKGLVDKIGGVDFDVDIDFKIQGRSYLKGRQHMDGQAVLDYLRVRKNLAKGETGDLNRIDRQKRMLVAIYEKIKENDLLASIPGILEAFDGNLYTNTTLAQTAALAAFAYQVPGENIQMYSMGGHYQNIFNWNFVLTDQKARVELIKKIYGIDVPQYKKYTSSAANALWESMQANDIQDKAKPVLQKVKAMLDADAQLPPEPPPVPVPDPATVPDPAAPAAAEPVMAASSVSGGAERKAALDGPYRKYFDDVWNLYNKTVAEVNNLTSIDSTDQKKAANLQAKADIESLCGIFSISAPNWRINYETSGNEVKVNFN